MGPKGRKVQVEKAQKTRSCFGGFVSHLKKKRKILYGGKINRNCFEILLLAQS